MHQKEDVEWLGANSTDFQALEGIVSGEGLWKDFGKPIEFCHAGQNEVFSFSSPNSQHFFTENQYAPHHLSVMNQKSATEHDYEKK